VILPRPCKVSCKFVFVTALVFCLAPAVGGQHFAQSQQTSTPDPWDQSQLMMPADLARLLAKQEGKRPFVVCVGFDFLYKGAHIPMSEYAGPGREAMGIEALKDWASGIPHNKIVVIYCGCCPMKQCPNIRPAFLALRRMGFKHLKVLDLENDLAKDWVDKSFATEKGSPK
jgi:thiosulfate/3-mercaptopyruvate sulfurtransferase